MPRNVRTVSVVRVVIAGQSRAGSGDVTDAVRSLGLECVGTAAMAAQVAAVADQHDADVVVMDADAAGPEWSDAAAAVWNDLGIPTILVADGGPLSWGADQEWPGVFGHLVRPVTPAHLGAAIAVGVARAGDALELTARVEKLEKTLVERRLIEQAKWRLVETRGMTESQAHSYIQQTARTSRRKALDLAQEILDGGPAAGAGPDRAG